MQRAEFTNLIHYSLNGDMPPHGNLDDVQHLLVFPFGLHRNKEGIYIGPGDTNIAVANHIVNHPILRMLEIITSEEVADALDNRQQGDTTVVSNLFEDRELTTWQWIENIEPRLMPQANEKIAIAGFNYHLPRAKANLHKRGISIVNPNMRWVGDFDSRSAQWWTRDLKRWRRREIFVDLASFALRQI